MMSKRFVAVSVEERSLAVGPFGHRPKLRLTATAARSKVCASTPPQATTELCHASLPKEGHPEVLPETAADFAKTKIPDLARALASKDAAGIAAAFARTADACNGCHQASGHPFIEVPRELGHAVPNTDPTATPERVPGAP